MQPNKPHRVSAILKGHGRVSKGLVVAFRILLRKDKASMAGPASQGKSVFWRFRL